MLSLVSSCAALCVSVPGHVCDLAAQCAASIQTGVQSPNSGTRLKASCFRRLLLPNRYTNKVAPGRQIVTSASKFKPSQKVKKTKATLTKERRQLKAEFDALEAKFVGVAKDPTKLKILWARMDSNGNGSISLAEIDKLVEQRYPLLNNKPALMRAYKQTCLKDGGDGDAFIQRHEFPMLLVS